MTRVELFDWLWPHCLDTAVSLQCGGEARGYFAWVYDRDDILRLIEAWRAGTLGTLTIETQTAEGKPYTARNIKRLGVVAHNGSTVERVCIDLDAHEGGVDNTGLVERMDEFFGARSVKFSSRSGSGVHLFYAIPTMPIGDWLTWVKAWGFNRAGEPEAFPKSAGLSQFWLPNEPNKNAGDTYIEGDAASATVIELPPAVVTEKTPTPKAMGSAGNGGQEGKPGTAFAKSDTPWTEILNGHLVREMDNRSYWRRPGKVGGGISATTGVCRTADGRDLLYVFTNNWYPFEQDRCYDKYSAFALLKHGGDWSAAASELSFLGYGERQRLTAGILPGVEALAAKLNGHSHEDDEPAPADDDSEDPGDLPELSVEGLIRDVVNWNRDTAMAWQPELAWAGAIALAAVITGRKVEDEKNTRTNVYLVGIAPAGSGKEHARKLNRLALADSGCESFLAPGDFASGAGIASLLDEHPTRLAQVDEIGDLLASIRASGPKSRHLATIETYLKEIYSSADSTWMTGGYADTSKNKVIRYPHLVLYGTGSPDKFWESITPSNIGDGVLPRLMIFSGSYVRNQDGARLACCPSHIAKRLQAWANWQPKPEGNLADVRAVVVPFDSAARKRLKEHQWEIAERRVKEDSIRAAVWSRTAEKSYKLALIFACSRVADPSAGSLQITLEDADNAVRLSNWLTRRMISQVWGKVGKNDRERNSKKLLEIIGEDKLTWNEITRKTQYMSRRERVELLTELEELGEIIISEVPPTSRGRPVKIVRKA